MIWSGAALCCLWLYTTRTPDSRSRAVVSGQQVAEPRVISSLTPPIAPAEATTSLTPSDALAVEATTSFTPSDALAMEF